MARFLIVAYGISWMLWSPLWLPYFGVGEMPVLPFQHYLGAAGPIAAAFVAGAAHGGRERAGELLQHMVLWRGRLGWAMVAVGGPFAILGMAVLVARLFAGENLELAGFGRSSEFPQLPVVGFFAFNLLTFGFGEEAGWRGFALPRLQAHHTAVGATVLLTPAWAVWHWPLFLYRPGYAGMDAADIVGWLFSLLTGGILLTWLYNESGGSILVVALFHAAVDVVFTSEIASVLVINTAGTLIAVSGGVVLVLAGPRFLSTRGKLIWPPGGSERCYSVIREDAP